MRYMKYALILVFLFSLSGCGYTNAALLPPELDSIHVSNFENMINTAKEVSDRRASYTYWPGLETDLTRAVIDGFIFDRHLSVESEEKATMTLTGELTDYHQLPLSYNNGGKDNADSVAEFRVEITVNLKLVNNITGKVMWQENNFMGQSTYNVSGANTKSESEAVRAAVKDIAQRIVERTVEAW